MKQKLISLCGYAGSGKGEASKFFQEHGYTNIKFAEALKDMLRCLLRHQGANDSMIERMIEGDLKEVPTEYLAGRTPRHAMQALGTEWGRTCIVDDFWAIAALTRAQGLPQVVIDDVRFENEADMIRKAGGIIIRIDRPDHRPVTNGHASENIPAADATVMNNGSIDDLRSELKRFL